MARNKECLTLLIDVGPSMHDLLPQVENLCSLLIEKKLIYSRYDEVGLVLFGTQDTKNELKDEVGGYDNIVVLRDMRVVGSDLAEALQPLPRGTVNVLDAVVVGMDMMIKKYEATNKGKKRLCLVTNALYAIKDPYQGTKEDQVSTIAEQMTVHGMRMESIIVRGMLNIKGDERVIDENDRLLSIFSDKTNAKMVYVDNPTSLLGALRTRNVSPVTVFRGELELSPEMKIQVWVYKKTSEERLPTLKKYSDKAPPTDMFAKHEVKVDYEYRVEEDPSKFVPPEERIKGYRYGPHVIPISSEELDAVKFKPDKGVKLLGHYYMKDVYIFVPEPDNTRAVQAVSALARAMEQTNEVAILRCVWRNGQTNVTVGVLTPNLSNKDNIPDSFYFNVLPLADDIREFQFPSFSNFPASWLPNEQQQEVADNFVKMLNLAPSGRTEILEPDLTPNPVLQRFYRHLALKSKQPDAALPPLDHSLKMITEPEPQLISNNKSTIDAFRGQFYLKENIKRKKSARRYLPEVPTGSDEGEVGDPTDTGVANSTENKLVVFEVDQIGDLTPVQDFEAMMSRRDSPTWIIKALTDMKKKIYKLVGDSSAVESYPKALECLVALRKGCILEQEPKDFNDFLRRLHKFCQDENQNFVHELVSRQITLISKSEAIDSEVTEDEAKAFLVKVEPKLE
ncbi:hypothetical protein ACFE04_026255 [Oxalis oulophora]